MPGIENAKLVDIEELKARKKGSISVCVIARDEEEHIAEALASVKDLADEMIVVDTGSHDGTILEAARLGARVFEVPWRNDFSEARNAALSKATKEWILVLDADEEIDPRDHERIRSLVRGGVEAAYIFEQRTYLGSNSLPRAETVLAEEPMARGCAFRFSDRQIRLFRNHTGISYACEIHENVEASVMLAETEVLDAGVAIHHYGRISPSNRVYRKTLLWCELSSAGLGACPGHPAYLYEIAAQLYELGRFGDVHAHADVALDLDPGAWEFLNLSGLAHLRQGNRERSILCLASALRVAGERHPDLCNNMGVALMENGESAEALIRFERGLETEPDNPDILRNAAAACALVGELEKGLEHVARSIAIDPFVAYSHAIHADLRFRMNDFEGSARVLASMRFLPDTPFKVYLKVIQLYTRMHMIAEAEEVVARACEAFPEREDLFYLAGKVAELRGDDARAVSFYQRVLAADPEHGDVLACLGCIHDRNERFEEALAAFREALRLKPGDVELEVNVGIVLDKLGHLDEAGRHFANAVGRGGDSGFVQNALGCHHARANRFDEALICFTKAVEFESDNAMYYQNLGLACEKMNLHDRAAEVYEKLAAVDPRTESFVRERLMRLKSPVA